MKCFCLRNRKKQKEKETEIDEKRKKERERVRSNKLSCFLKVPLYRNKQMDRIDKCNVLNVNMM